MIIPCELLCIPLSLCLYHSTYETMQVMSTVQRNLAVSPTSRLMFSGGCRMWGSPHTFTANRGGGQHSVGVSTHIYHSSRCSSVPYLQTCRYNIYCKIYQGVVLLILSKILSPIFSQSKPSWQGKKRQIHNTSILMAVALVMKEIKTF